jgi:hypothetical protein
MNKQDIWKSEWDTLIVLDACRYDYFKEEISNYLDGELEPQQSPASCTYTWLQRMCPDEYDVYVYSGHPGINSVGISRSSKWPYNSSKHFSRILDIWKFGWSEDLSTTPPQAVVTMVNNDIITGNYKGKNIIWFIQPHLPYVGDTRLMSPRKNWDDFKPIKQMIKDIESGAISRDKLRQAYRDNLKLVLASVARMIKNIKGTTIITSDHGELLMEGNMFGHPSNFDNPLLRTVPWFKVKS